MPDESQSFSYAQVIELLRPSRASQLTPAQHRLATLFAEIYADLPEAQDVLNAFIRRPGCGSCRRDMMMLMAQDPQRFERYTSHLDFNKALGMQPLDESDELPGTDGPVRETQRLDGRPTRLAPTSMAGEVRIISDTPGAYYDLIKQLNTLNARFSGLAVRKEGDELHVYFY